MNKNNARVGFTIQKIICDTFGIVPDSKYAVKQFETSFDSKYKAEFDSIVDSVFKALNAKPIKCTTFSLNKRNEKIPYNFLLDNNLTLSVRTNMKGSKVAPRNVGQAGYAKLNEYFSEIYGKMIRNQDDIKKLITNQIDEVLPIFFENLFDADIILWIFFDHGIYKYHFIKSDTVLSMKFEKNRLTFTRPYSEWVESTTLKYNDKAIAEIQVHKERTFKFRFNMVNVIPLLIQKDNNNETFGITLEKTICDKFSLRYPLHFYKRYSVKLEAQLKTVVNDAFKKLPSPIEHTGSKKGIRGGESKCSYDFILEGNKTLSVKSNIGKMVCPPEVGQPSSDTCYLYFKNFISEKYINKDIFKNMILEHIDLIFPIYVQHMFDSDYLLRIFNSMNGYDYKILKKDYATNFSRDKNKFSFTKKLLMNGMKAIHLNIPELR